MVPSQGLAKELLSEFPALSGKMAVLPNAVDVEAFRSHNSFDRNGFRLQLGLKHTDVVFLFVALGHFERKGLPLLLEVLRAPGLQAAKLLVVGGTPDLVNYYRSHCKDLGLEDRVVFVGSQTDVKRYMWAADVFALASTYETFSLVAFEAGAASLPLITPRLYGIEEIVEDGVTGYVVDRSVEDFADAFNKFLALSPKARTEMGNRARLAALQYNETNFVARWRMLYEQMAVWKLSKGESDCVRVSREKTTQNI